MVNVKEDSSERLCKSICNHLVRWQILYWYITMFNTFSNPRIILYLNAICLVPSRPALSLWRINLIVDWLSYYNIVGIEYIKLISVKKFWSQRIFWQAEWVATNSATVEESAVIVCFLDRKRNAQDIGRDVLIYQIAICYPNSNNNNNNNNNNQHKHIKWRVCYKNRKWVLNWRLRQYNEAVDQLLPCPWKPLNCFAEKAELLNIESLVAYEMINIGCHLLFLETVFAC